MKIYNYSNLMKKFNLQCDDLYDDTELFKEITIIDGYQIIPGYYISSVGRLFSSKSNKFIKPFKDKYNYFRYSLPLQDGGKRNFQTHRIVGNTFIKTQNYFDRKTNVIDHKRPAIGWNTIDNMVENLEFVTQSENNLRVIKLDNGSQYKQKGELNPSVVHTEEEVIQVCDLLEKGLTSKQILTQLGFEISVKNISWIESIRQRKTWTYISINYHWKNFKLTRMNSFKKYTDQAKNIIDEHPEYNPKEIARILNVNIDDPHDKRNFKAFIKKLR